VSPGLGLAAALLAATPLVVSVGGSAEEPAYLPVHAAAALGTFAAEGAPVTLQPSKHPVAAVDALREGRAAVAVTTADQAVRGAWARGTPVRILVAHTRAPEVALVVSAKHRDRVRRVEALRGQPVGMPGPGTTGHLVLTALLARARLGPADLTLLSPGASAMLARLGSGDLVAAILEEPWTTRALEAGVGDVLVDLRRPEDAARHLGGPFYEVASVARVGEGAEADLEPALAAYARALIRVLAWLAATAPAEVAERLPASLVGDPERFRARLERARAAYVSDGHATEAGLRATLRALRGGSPWPVTLKLGPDGLQEPAFVGAARAALGPAPPAP
jgi:NitT/TauT family transport system substrate-binding protein